jgi:peptide/nickel transport system permease protein
MQPSDTVIRLWRSPTSRIGFLCIGVLLLLAITASFLSPTDSAGAQNYTARLLSPSLSHPLGTDGLGRELWQVAWYGIHLSMLVSVASVSLGCIVGLLLGVIAGYWRGGWELTIGWLTDILLAFPPILLAIVIATLLGPSLISVTIAISVVQIPIYTRLTRSLTLSLSEQPFVLAAESMGASAWRIMTRHILPACLGSLTVQAALSTGTAILEAAGLGFLGLGPQPPTPELGTLLADAFRNGYSLSAPWTMIVPGSIITLMVFAFNLLGDGLRDSLDPRSRTLQSSASRSQSPLDPTVGN